MTVTAANILTAATVPAYLEGRWDEISTALQVDLEAPSAVEGIEVEAIQGGNVNYAFRVTLANLGGDNKKKTIFLKQVTTGVAAAAVRSFVCCRRACFA